jgi:hypothetical protein
MPLALRKGGEIFREGFGLSELSEGARIGHTLVKFGTCDLSQYPRGLEGTVTGIRHDEKRSKLLSACAKNLEHLESDYARTMAQGLPEFEFDAAPRAGHCEKCGSDNDLRFMIVRGRTRYEGRTLCDTCAEEVLETLIVADLHAAKHKP